MQQIQFNDANTTFDNLYAAPIKRKPKPRKWREIESVKAKLLLAKELREIDPSYSLSQSELV